MAGHVIDGLLMPNTSNLLTNVSIPLMAGHVIDEPSVYYTDLTRINCTFSVTTSSDSDLGTNFCSDVIKKHSLILVLVLS